MQYKLTNFWRGQCFKQKEGRVTQISKGKPSISADGSENLNLLHKKPVLFYSTGETKPRPSVLGKDEQ